MKLVPVLNMPTTLTSLGPVVHTRRLRAREFRLAGLARLPPGNIASLSCASPLCWAGKAAREWGKYSCQEKMGHAHARWLAGRPRRRQRAIRSSIDAEGVAALGQELAAGIKSGEPKANGAHRKN